MILYTYKLPVGGFGGGGLTALSSLVLGNSDFLTGAFLAEYGNTLAGVLDLKLRNGNNTQREHTASLGTMGIDLSSEGPFKKGGKASFLFNYRYSTLWMISSFLPDGAGQTSNGCITPSARIILYHVCSTWMKRLLIFMQRLFPL